MIDGQLTPRVLAFIINDAQHRGGIADHRFQGIGGFGRARLLHKVQQRGDGHHQGDHPGGKEIFRGVGGDPQQREQQIERIAVAGPEVPPPGGRLLRRNLVVAMGFAHGGHLGRIQPFRVAAKGVPQRLFVHRRHAQAVGRKAIWQGGIGQLFASHHRVALYQTTRQVAAQLAEQQLG